MIKAVAVQGPLVHAIDHHAVHIVLPDAAVPGGGVPFEWGIVGDVVTKHKIVSRVACGPTTSRAVLSLMSVGLSG